MQPIFNDSVVILYFRPKLHRYRSLLKSQLIKFVTVPNQKNMVPVPNLLDAVVKKHQPS